VFTRGGSPSGGIDSFGPVGESELGKGTRPRRCYRSIHVPGPRRPGQSRTDSSTRPDGGAAYRNGKRGRKRLETRESLAGVTAAG